MFYRGYDQLGNVFIFSYFILISKCFERKLKEMKPQKAIRIVERARVCAALKMRVIEFVVCCSANFSLI